MYRRRARAIPAAAVRFAPGMQCDVPAVSQHTSQPLKELVLKRIAAYAAPLLALGLNACIGLTGPALVPGESPASAVDARLGPVTEVHHLADGESVRYYSRQPWGHQTFAAHIGADGRFRTLEQVMTEDNVARLHAGVSSTQEVREVLGPPYSVDTFPRLQREVWSYKLQSFNSQRKDLIVQFSRDGVAREIFMVDEQHWMSGAGEPLPGTGVS